MTIQTIDLATPNTGMGTDLRAGGELINANFQELDARLTAAESALVGKQPTVTVLEVEGLTYDLAAANNHAYLHFSGSSAKTITVRPESVHALPPNGEWHIDNAGTGDATLVAGDAVTLLPPKGGSLVLEQHDVVTLKRLGPDLFRLIGSTKAAS